MNLKTIFLTLLLTILPTFPTLAEKPPKRLLQYVASQELVHNGRCKIQKQRGVECLIYRDEANDITWLILFDGPPARITAIIGVKDGQEVVLWSDAI